jgi:hypothetical protein
MTLVFTEKNTIEQIVEIAEKLTKEEQLMFLAQMNAAKLLHENKKFIRVDNLKPLTMAQIDAIKHKSRKQNEGK